ncbi:unnamed protein product [Tilletia caries]|nr:hypothetical protein CF335_g9062 [Tilletia laevis]CAD6892284.1 unnamed protein product [Tilletia caries]CAD6925213.1 unnamed protein product [Tilletia caries]CAD6956444.1 unnamed protein product [Tilletia caries]
MFKSSRKDRTTQATESPLGAQGQRAVQDATTAAADYINARYLSSTEATWRVFGFKLTSKIPTVIRLSVHEPGGNRGQFGGRRNQASEASTLLASEASTLLRYFLRPHHLSHLTYTD